MWPDRVSNPEPLTYESGALPTVLRGPGENPKREEFMSLKILKLPINKVYKL